MAERSTHGRTVVGNLFQVFPRRRPDLHLARGGAKRPGFLATLQSASRRTWAGALLVLTSLFALLPAANAGEAKPLAADPVLEARVMQVAEELRCLVCQNETLAASEADLAVDLRRQIRERLQHGDQPGQIVDFMVARYGQFVRYRPALTVTTAILWFGPFLLLALGAVVLLATLRDRRRRGPTVVAPLDPGERQRLARLLAEVKTTP